MPIETHGSEPSGETSIVDVRVDDRQLVADLSDGRQIAAPIRWYPRLHAATPGQRANWRLVGQGYGVHWPDVDEDVSLDMLLRGLPSLEAQELSS